MNLKSLLAASRIKLSFHFPNSTSVYLIRGSRKWLYTTRSSMENVRGSKAPSSRNERNFPASGWPNSKLSFPSSPPTGPALGGTARRVDDMLRSLRAGRPHSDPATLLHATYLCNMTGRCDQLVAVAGEWFRQSRPLFDRMDQFKASSVLCNLGKANRATAGGTVRALGWPPIEYFARRMLRMGLDRFQAEDVASALSGINDLVKFSEKDSIGKRGGEISSCLRSVLSAFELYLAGKCEADDDWPALVREVAPMALLYVKDIYFATGLEEKETLVRELFRLSAIGFDQIASETSGQRSAAAFTNDMYVNSCLVFGKVCFMFDCGLESIGPNSWRSWFDIYLRCLRLNRGVSMSDFSNVVKLARKCAVFRSAAFWPRFDAWHRSLVDHVRLCSRTGGDNRLDAFLTRRRATNLLYNLGKLANACRDEGDLRVRVADLGAIARLMDDAISRDDRVDGVSVVQQLKVLSGFVQLRRALELHDLEPSASLYLRLAEWCAQSARLVDTAAIARLLSSLRPPQFLLEALAASFCRGLDSPAVVEAQALLDVGRACLRLDWDPCNAGPLAHFWRLYFGKAGDCLCRGPVNTCGGVGTALDALTLLPLLALRFKQIDTFNAITGVYKEKLSQYGSQLAPRNGDWLTDALRLIESETLSRSSETSEDIVRRGEFILRMRINTNTFCTQRGQQ